MGDPTRTRASRQLANRALLRAFADFWDAYPEQRFGQLVMNLSRESGGFADTWEWSNAEWRRRIDETWSEFDRQHRPAPVTEGTA